MAVTTPNFLNSNATEDEPGCLRYEPEKKGKAWNGVLLPYFVERRSEQKNHASKRSSSPFLTVKTLFRRIYLRE
ncbi:hypothetical protein TNCT_223031 [Trichonephila clavata]|uniref:Uncharacterized protein n=1 Tax=Trichonephila clavata TaxID=2740835 RepID=A0A8X6HFI8_TRICU|nr:hypothetical protein TNCT_223031 [Trichonephila clavata]